MPGKFKSRVPWRQKIENASPSRLVPISEPMVKRFGPGVFLIPNAPALDVLVRTIPPGKLTTTDAIRARLAQDHGAVTTCAMVTGIMLRIVAEAAEEDRRMHRTEIAPYWRVVRPDGSLIPKFPGGAASQARLLRAEGHEISRAKGKTAPKVKDFEQKLLSLEKPKAMAAVPAR